MGAARTEEKRRGSRRVARGAKCILSFVEVWTAWFDVCFLRWMLFVGRGCIVFGEDVGVKMFMKRKCEIEEGDYL